MSDGTYEEALPCGGKLKVESTCWEIEYYFPGPDMRYRGEFVRIPGDAIEGYIAALEKNWSEYQSLKRKIPKGGEFSKVGENGMTINIGGFFEGVCLRSHHLKISSAGRLSDVIGGYRHAAARAPKIQKFLASLE